MQLRKKRAKEWRREWRSFSLSAYAPLTIEEFLDFAGTEHRDDVDEIYERAVEIAGFSPEWTEWWLELWTKIPVTGDRVDFDHHPSDLPKPPAIPEGVVERARSTDDRIAGAYALAMLAYAMRINQLG